MEIRTVNSIYSLIPRLGILVNSELKNEFRHLLPNPLNEDRIIAGLRKELTNEEIEAHILSINNILFNITENCNFRCKYCIYSGDYEMVRIHNQSKMSFETAQKIIEHLANWVGNEKRRTKTNIINIGFYGGEALLEIHLVRKIINYAKKRFQSEKVLEKYKFRFLLNTNGYLLNDANVDFLVDNNIFIDVSLDGPQEEHDKFRVTKNGDKTWATIWNNLKRLKSRYPDYWNNVGFLATLHPIHCFEKIDNFFFDNTDFFEKNRISAYPVNRRHLKDYAKKKLDENLEQQRSLISIKQLEKKLDNKLIMRDINYETKYTAMCSPGEAKIFADTDGSLHICERVKSNLPIGDAENGINYDAVREIYRQWNEEIIKNRCWDCDAWSFCGVCLAQNDSENGIMIDCKYKEKAKRILFNYISFKEEEDRKKKELDIMPNNINDYIRELK
jgi:uncharacterized protein